MRPDLTDREHEFYYQMVDECRSIKESADVMSISEETGKQHWKNIKMKLQLNKITELSKYYFTCYSKNIGSAMLLLLLTIQIASYNSDVVRRVRRGRRNEDTVLNWEDYGY